MRPPRARRALRARRNRGRLTTRREFLVAAGRRTLHVGAAATVVATGVGLTYGARPTTPRERVGAPHLRPPGAMPEAAFLAHCIRCQRCSEVCSVGAIRLLDGAAGVRQGTPVIRPATKACTMCLRCTQVCPTGALEPLTARTAVRMGVARVDERLCVSYIDRGACGACYTACPLRGKAITQGLLNRPVVNAEVCTGCGQCEEVCIVQDNKAIRVWARPAVAA